MSYATIYLPNSGIIAAYGENLDELNQAVGIYLITWFMVTFLLLCVALSFKFYATSNASLIFRIGALRRNISFIALLFFLCITFILLAAGAWTGKLNIQKAGGGFGILTAMIAYYCGLSELLVKGESWFGLPMGTIKQGRVD